ncbi:LamG-like jellyroll fold domain-containing protein [Lewinella sp. 4G2]|uniref:LamG-like jellyroll fold domain-containing protein n=1 Tax=Lewinella sp. 4G2 TaxID=1803372 RepID=UPI0007B4E756|nr:LamG-like jellyroll fold domain-containing protein [Lewinella sp. 4G2]OAV44013.1 hypothetical protein A3850_005670 [Lewinella sp. 4G2]
MLRFLVFAFSWILLASLPAHAQITFTGPTAFGRATADVAVADFDGDGNVDLFACGGNQYWYAGPDFTTEYQMGTSAGGPYAAEAADINNDGWPDLVTSDGARNSGPGNTYLYLNPGPDGDVYAPWTRITMYTGNVSHQNDMVVIDVDGDGRLDVVTRTWTDQRVMIYFQNADINNWTAKILGDNDAGRDEGLAVGDLDGEPGVEIVLSGIYWKSDDWRAQTGVPITYSIDPNLTGVFGKVKAAIGDLDGDGDADVYMGTAEGSVQYLAWHENTGLNPDGSVNYVTRILRDDTGDAHFADLGDVDNDGDLDIFLGRSFGSNGCYVFVNDGEGNFTETNYDPGGKLYLGDVADLDGDGDLDVAGAPRFYNGRPVVYYNTTSTLPRAGEVSIAPQGGNFTAPVTVTLSATGLVEDIRYTTDGSEPDGTSTLYTGPFTLASSTLLRTRASAQNAAPGPVNSANYNIAQNGNFPPIARAGEDRTVNINTTVTLDGSESTDLDDATLNYAWTQFDGPATTILNATTATAQFTPTEAGRYEFELAVSDEAEQATDVVIITVVDPGQAQVAYWPLDETAGTNVPELVAGQDGTLTTADNWRPADGQFGGALDVATERVELPAIDVDAAGLTLAAWVRPTALTTAEGRFISKADGVTGNQHYWMLSQISTTGVRFRLKTDAQTTTATLASPTGQLRAEEWTFVAATYDGAQMRLYVDGTEVASMAQTGRVAQAPNVAVALGNQPTDAGDRPFNGLLDEVTIWNRALSPVELIDLQATNTIGGATLPVRYLSFTAEREKADVLLNWETTNETDNAGFYVERMSPTGLAQAGFVAARLDGRYATRDETVPPGDLRYRLRQEDLDGSTSYSPWVEVAALAESVLATPNPARGQTWLRGLPEGTVVQLLDFRGRDYGRHRLGTDGMLDLSGLPLGGYIFVWTGGAGRLVVAGKGR